MRACDRRQRKRPGDRRWAFAAVALSLASLTAGGSASAFCRTTTCPLPAGFAPSPGQCYPPNFISRCASLTPSVAVLPVYWANACVSYDIQADASRQVPYSAAQKLFADAFAKWTGATCAGGGRVSVSLEDRGPVQCNEVQYSSNQGNQHVIIFDDQKWPHDDASNTLGLTTITFNPTTGEIYDADMEINSTADVPLSLGVPPPTGYDFQSIIAHETGHFLGMAHSDDPNATMVAHYQQGTTSMRTLSIDDAAGICSIYLPDGNRAVDPSVARSGVLPEAACDSTPRHGFQSACAGPTPSQCSLSAAALASTGCPPFFAVAGAALTMAAGVRRRRSEASPRRRDVVAHARNGVSATARRHRRR